MRCWEDWVCAMLGYLFFRHRSQEDRWRSEGESCGSVGLEYEGRQSTSAAPALQMTIVVGRRKRKLELERLPPFNIKCSRWPRPSINNYDMPSRAVYTSTRRFAVH